MPPGSGLATPGLFKLPPKLNSENGASAGHPIKCKGTYRASWPCMEPSPVTPGSAGGVRKMYKTKKTSNDIIAEDGR